MDKQSSAANIIKLINKVRNNNNTTPELINSVCRYFDEIKSSTLSNSDLLFLRFVANEAGIPQYYEILKSQFQRNIEERHLDIRLDSLSTLIKESSLYVGEGVSLHRYQKEVLDKYDIHRRNRFFLSASTSFGKTFLVFEILRKMQYRNVFLIYPTIALLSENIVKIFTSNEYKWIKDQYKIHTISDVSDFGDYNLYVYTPERFLSFIDKNYQFENDFVFIDEAYKIDNEYLENEELHENERDVAYRIVLNIALSKSNTDCLLVGPYINVRQRGVDNKNQSFYCFLDNYCIDILDYNNVEIVQKTEFDACGKSKIVVDNGAYTIDLSLCTTKKSRFISLSKQLIEKGDNIIVYCSRKSDVEQYAKCLIESQYFPDINTLPFQSFINHIAKSFLGESGENWVVTKALKKGIGIHHGLVPKYIQNEIIRLYNEGFIKVLICTTTITEGVNTSGKNMIVLSHKKGKKELKPFDAKNIEGRAGRFFYHYTGRVFLLDRRFKDKAHAEEEGLVHKHFDKSTHKSDVDFPYVSKDYLNDTDVELKRHWIEMIETSEIDNRILDCYKTISIQNKICLYSAIKRLTDLEKKEISYVIKAYNGQHRIYKNGLELIFKIINPIVSKESQLSSLIEHKSEANDYCTLTNMLPVFLEKGFSGEVNYYVSRGKTVDEAVRYTANLFYNTFRYQAVKYLGLFNLIYKYVIAIQNGSAINEVSGIDALLLKLEYNADTDLGRKASDIGAPFNVIQYFDEIGRNAEIPPSTKLDAYERQTVDQIRNIVLNN